MGKARPAESKSKRLTEFQLGRVTYQVGDCLLINQPKEEKHPYVGRLIEILDSKPDGEIVVEWFYRPEDPNIPGGRKEFHGVSELFASHHQDRIAKGSILSKCYVHDIEDYKKLTEAGEDTFYTRWFFDHNKKIFEPDQVPVYCTCEKPYNPDYEMIECDQCKEWYHFHCLGLHPDTDFSGEPYICHQCSDKQQDSYRYSKRPRSEQSGCSGYD